jgi:hypothetical protein
MFSRFAPLAHRFRTAMQMQNPRFRSAYIWNDSSTAFAPELVGCLVVTGVLGIAFTFNSLATMSARVSRTLPQRHSVYTRNALTTISGVELCCKDLEGNFLLLREQGLVVVRVVRVVKSDLLSSACEGLSLASTSRTFTSAVSAVLVLAVVISAITE